MTQESVILILLSRDNLSRDRLSRASCVVYVLFLNVFFFANKMTKHRTLPTLAKKFISSTHILGGIKFVRTFSVQGFLEK